MNEDHLKKMREILARFGEDFKEFLAYSAVFSKEFDQLSAQLASKKEQLRLIEEKEQALDKRTQELATLEAQETAIKETRLQLDGERKLLGKEKEALLIRSKQVQAKEDDLNRRIAQVNQILQ